MKTKTRYHCPHFGCKKSYTRRDYVERHAVNHMVTKPYICLVCDRYFSRADLFEHHMDTKYHRKRAEKYQHPDHPWQAPENLVGQEFDPQTGVPVHYETSDEYSSSRNSSKTVASPNELTSPSDQPPNSDSYFVYQQQQHKQHESTSASSYYYPSQPMYVTPGSNGSVQPPVPRGAHLLHNLNTLHQQLMSSPIVSQQQPPTAPQQPQTPQSAHLQQQPPMLMSQHGPLATQQVYPWLPSQANPIHYV